MQSQVGCFNWANGNEKTFEFSLGLFDDDGKIIKQNGIAAQLRFSGSPDAESDFADPIECLGDVFTRCTSYGDSVWSSVPYKAQCLLFGRLYIEHYEAINATMLDAKRKRLTAEIERLRAELGNEVAVPELHWEMCGAVDTEVKSLERRIGVYSRDLDNLKEGTEAFEKCSNTLTGLTARLEEVKSYRPE
jgi:hypothetical protein